MKTLEITNFEVFKELYEINLNKQPNQVFTTTINQQIYKITINTFIDNKTFISIEKNGEVIGQGFIKIGIDFTYLSTKEQGQFFFLKKVNSDLISFNYSDFGENIVFYYGVLAENANELGELELKYSLLKNNEALAEW